jgi:4-carboxymuconolactone decarboxylase
MSEELTPAQKMIGDFAPKLVQLTDDVLFGDIWQRPGLIGGTRPHGAGRR